MKMGMGIGINTERPDEGQLRGRQEPVACYVWFTSTGRAMPRKLKYQNDDGSLSEIDHINVISESDKNYCVIPTIEYECSCEIKEIVYNFHLLYYLEDHKWAMYWKYS